jgi:hypothetical protein
LRDSAGLTPDFAGLDATRGARPRVIGPYRPGLVSVKND